MGITIHYKFNAGERPVQEIRKLIDTLYQSAKDLPFEYLDEIVELTGTECLSTVDSTPDPWDLLKIQAQKIDIIDAKIVQTNPTHIMGFTVVPRQGAEGLAILLSQHEGSSIWTARGSCKTQYAALPEYGGSTANFVLAHTIVIALLDKAKELGILEEVLDESGYWQNRNPKKLIAKGEKWNAIIADINKVLGQIPPPLKNFFSE